jgi:hypothetical protein
MMKANTNNAEQKAAAAAAAARGNGRDSPRRPPVSLPTQAKDMSLPPPSRAQKKSRLRFSFPRRLRPPKKRKKKTCLVLLDCLLVVPFGDHAGRADSTGNNMPMARAEKATGEEEEEEEVAGRR